jgi:hypothetical protein
LSDAVQAVRRSCIFQPMPERSLELLAACQDLLTAVAIP